MAAKAKHVGLTTAPGGTWVQTDRAAHEAWAKLIGANPRAAALMHVIVGNMGRHNALVASVPTLQKMMGCSRNTVLRAINVLKEQNWLEVRQIGGAGTSNAYVVNDRVAWSGKREGIRHSLFSAAVLVSDDEQPDRDELGSQPPLQRLPAMYPGEHQLPAGSGLPPPSQPFLGGMEPDLPATQRGDPDDQMDVEAYLALKDQAG
ncbi:helix-turn-helix domain-containing protein [Novosphingobium gossypii]|uniref:helix-turn-helix domain-containing protein n=1 Tax=Novosphingobium gossypii TaxID=1604774 RepID=UPI003D209FCA